MGAVVLRVVTSPEIRTEYLDDKRQWTPNREKAHGYPDHTAADEIANLFRIRGEDHVHAAVCDRPYRRLFLRPDRDNAPADFVMPKPPRRRKSRREQELEQMRQDDLRELELHEIYD